MLSLPENCFKSLRIVLLKRICWFDFRFVGRWSISILVGCSKMRELLLLLFCLIFYCMRCKGLRSCYWLILRRNFNHRKRFISWIICLGLYSFDILVSQRPLIVDYVFRRCSFIIVYLQTWSNEIFIMITKLNISFKHLINSTCCYFLEQNRFNFLFPR